MLHPRATASAAATPAACPTAMAMGVTRTAPGAGVVEQIAIAGAIHKDAGLHTPESRLGADQQLLDAAPVHVCVGEHGVEQHFDTRFRKHLLERHLEALGVERGDRRGVADGVGYVAGRGSGLHQSLHQLVRNATDHLLCACMEGHHGVDALCGQSAAQEAILLHNQDPHPQACRGQRGHAAGRSTSGYHHVI